MGNIKSKPTRDFKKEGPGGGGGHIILGGNSRKALRRESEEIARRISSLRKAIKENAGGMWAFEIEKRGLPGIAASFTEESDSGRSYVKSGGLLCSWETFQEEGGE